MRACAGVRGEPDITRPRRPATAPTGNAPRGGPVRALHLVAGTWRLAEAVARTAAPTVVAAAAAHDRLPPVDVVHAHEGALAAGRRLAVARGVPLVVTVGPLDRLADAGAADLRLVPGATDAGAGDVRVAPLAVPPGQLAAITDPAVRFRRLAAEGAHAVAGDLDAWYRALVADGPVPDAPPPSTPPTVTVVVPTFDRPDLLARCLDALAAQSLPADLVDVVVVDDASTDPRVATVLDDAATRFAGRLRVVRNDRNLGAAGSRNRGVAVATGAVVAFTDDDCRPAPTWLEHLLSALRDDVGLAQGRTRPDPAVPVGPTDRSQWTSSEHGLYETCNVAHRRVALASLDGPPFDEGLQAEVRAVVGRTVAAHGFGEDSDLGWRVREAGWATRFVPDAVVDHHVFTDDLPHLLRRSLLAGAFPVLVRAHPGLRDTLLWRRTFLGRRHAWLAAGLLAAAASRRRGGALLLLPWLVDLLDLGRPGQRARLRAAPVRALRDVVELVACLHGSARTGTLVL